MIEEHMREKLIGKTITNVYEPEVSEVVRGYIQYDKRPLLAVHYRFADKTEQNQKAEDTTQKKPFVEFATEHFVNRTIERVDIHLDSGEYYVGVYVDDVSEDGKVALQVPLHIHTHHIDEQGDPDVSDIPIWITRVIGLEPPEKHPEEQVVEEPADE